MTQTTALDYCEDACQLCLGAIDQLTSTTTTVVVSSMQRGGSSTMLPKKKGNNNNNHNHHHHHKQLVVVCDVLIRLYDGMNKLLSRQCSTYTQQQQQQRGGEEGGEEVLALLTTCVDSIANTIHLAILKVIRGICYVTTTTNEDDGVVSVMEQPLLSLEAVRPVTGMLLPKLYPSDGVGGDGGGGLKEQQRAVELWNEMLLLLSPHSEEVLIGNRKCCQNW